MVTNVDNDDVNILSLGFKGYENSIQGVWKELQSENHFSDVTLACEDKQIKAHKIILSFCSPLLQNILKQNQNPNSYIYLRGVSSTDLEHLVTFMYQGKVTIRPEDVDSFRAIAEDLKLSGLSDENEESSNSKVQLTPSPIRRQTLKKENDGLFDEFLDIAENEPIMKKDNSIHQILHEESNFIDDEAKEERTSCC